MALGGPGNSAPLLASPQPQVQAARAERSSMAGVLRGGHGHNVLQSLADVECAPLYPLYP